MKIIEENMFTYLQYQKLTKYLSHNTIRSYLSDLNHFLNFTKQYDSQLLDDTYILHYLTFMHKIPLKPRTIARRLIVLKSFFIYLVNLKILTTSPFETLDIKIKLPKDLPKIISTDTTSKLLSYLYFLKTTNLTNYQYKKVIRDIAIIEILIGTGIRVSELCNLKEKDIYIKEKYIYISGKGNKERLVFINTDEILEALNEHIKVNRPKDFIFKNKCGNRLSEQAVGLLLKRYSLLLNITEKITPHMYRHTFASSLAEDDINLVYIKNILGHNSISTTQRYTHMSNIKHSNIMKYNNPRRKITPDNN